MYASLGALATLETVAAWNQAILGVTARPGIDQRYLRYSLEHSRGSLVAMARSSTQDNLNREQVGNLVVFQASFEGQRRIADFLDRECERIESLVRAKERLSAVARQAGQDRVSRELDLDAVSAPVQKLGWHMQVIAGYAFRSEGFTHVSSDVRLLRGTNVAVGRTDWTDTVYWPREDVSRFAQWQLRAGDLVLGLDRPWIKGGIRVAELRSADTPALLLQRVACVRPTTGHLIGPYVRLWLEHERFFGELATEMTGVSVPHISPGQVAAFRLPVPDLDRQRTVVRIATEGREAADRMEGALAGLKAGLADYRNALITEAVTGEFDVASVSEAQMDERAHAAAECEPVEFASQ